MVSFPCHLSFIFPVLFCSSCFCFVFISFFHFSFHFLFIFEYYQHFDVSFHFSFKARATHLPEKSRSRDDSNRTPVLLSVILQRTRVTTNPSRPRWRLDRFQWAGYLSFFTVSALRLFNSALASGPAAIVLISFVECRRSFVVTFLLFLFAGFVVVAVGTGVAQPSKRRKRVLLCCLPLRQRGVVACFLGLEWSDCNLWVLHICFDVVACTSYTDLAYFPFRCGSYLTLHGAVGLESAVEVTWLRRVQAYLAP